MYLALYFRACNSNKVGVYMRRYPDRHSFLSNKIIHYLFICSFKNHICWYTIQNVCWLFNYLRKLYGALALLSYLKIRQTPSPFWYWFRYEVLIATCSVTLITCAIDMLVLFLHKVVCINWLNKKIFFKSISSSKWKFILSSIIHVICSTYTRVQWKTHSTLTLCCPACQIWPV